MFFKKMFCGRFFQYNLFSIIVFLFVVKNCQTKDTNVLYLDESNWNYLLKDEWMVQFFAPWCPACKNLKTTWDDLSLVTKNIKIAKIDVTEAPALSGRFFVTALPTIFHVINGEFRQYRGPRDLISLQSFIDKKEWEKLEPISSWKRPDSIQMSVVANFFKLSHYLKELNNLLNEKYGMPMWLAYGIFAIATILLGALLGLIFVCVADFIFPPKESKRKSFSKDETNNEDDLIKDEIEGGDDEDEAALLDNDDEIVSSNDEENDEENLTESDRAPDTPNKTEVRKRKSRKE